MRLLARRTEGIFVAPFEQGAIGPDTCSAPPANSGFEGLASKRRDSRYQTGLSPDWIK
jgi:bifunctional non-homologous end joining protein LigD